jgi:RNA polymerase sigma-70 factor (ECF subfamily)
MSIREELCEEAIRLTTILVNNKAGQMPETFALLALMYLHMARMTARQDSSGGLILLEQQNRSLWDRKKIETGLEWLEKSSYGDNFSRYHAEAGIAAEHCLAISFHETRWDKIAENYLLLEKVAPSAIHRLNRAVAVAEWHGPTAGLDVLQGFEPPGWLTGSYQWSAVLADLHQRSGNTRIAKDYRGDALNSAPTAAIKQLLLRRLKIDPID